MPHWTFAVYDEVTGEITGRIRTNCPQVVESHPNRIDITVEQAAAAVELTHRVDVAHLKRARALGGPVHPRLIPKDKKG